jgi:nitrite reductase/ring-hydroxylating ferredoxin subunit
VATCELCGNEYDKTMEITVGGKSHTFDSFECAIHVLAPACPHCDCRIIGHGVEAGDRIFCCAHCARESGATGVADRA